MFKTAFSQKNVNNLDTLRQISTVTIDFKLADIKLGSSEAFLLKFRAQNNGRSTDNVRPDRRLDRSNSRLAGHFYRSVLDGCRLMRFAL